MFQYLDYVYEVYRTGSFSKAAQNLFLTQPALSIAVKKEEAAVGMPIFDRSSSPLHLTQAGEAYIESAQKIRSIQDTLALYCNDLSCLKTGKVKIGASNFFLSQVALLVISEFVKLYPGIDIDILEAPSLDLKQHIADENLDLIIDPFPASDTDGFLRHPLFNDCFLLTAPISMDTNKSLRQYQLTREQIMENYHLSSFCPSVPLEAFAQSPFILLRPDTVTYARAIQICQKYGFTPHVRFYLDQLITSYRFAAQGLGVAFISDTLVKLTPIEESVVFYKLGSPLAMREIFAVHKKNRYLSRASAAFIETAERMLKEKMR